MLLTGVLMVGCTTPQAGPVRRPAPVAPNVYYYYTEAQILRAQGEYREALALMQQAMDLDPDSRLLQRETAVLYLQLKNEDAALALLEKLLAAHPDDIEALNIMGRLLQSRKRNDDAKKVYARILAQDPDNEDIYLLLGNLYMADDQWDAALDVFEQFVQRFPDAYAGYFFLGKIYRAQNDPVAAEKAFGKALQIEPELEGARFELIELYAADLDKTEHQNRIVQLYEELLKDNPQNIRAIFGYALFQRDRGQTKGAGRVLATYAGDISQNDLIRGIFRYYIEAENYRDADYLLARLIELHPGYNDLHYLQGLASDGLKEYEKALAQFRAVTPKAVFTAKPQSKSLSAMRKMGATIWPLRILKALWQGIRKIRNS